ncbi:MAG TPA: YraN family protein [Oscillospiraceae bacterium]|nr:YraN family protein [Oscillospiraceae bacterium]
MNNASGKIGEEFTAKLLKEKGYQIVDTNYHSRYGEIDIIAQDAKYIVFVEVKTREENSMINPLEAVTSSKQKKIIKTALLYLQSHKTDLQPRFDVAGLVTNANDMSIRSVNYITNAFEGGTTF